MNATGGPRTLEDNNRVQMPDLTIGKHLTPRFSSNNKTVGEFLSLNARLQSGPGTTRNAGQSQYASNKINHVTDAYRK